jgi:hypothetical protein
MFGDSIWFLNPQQRGQTRAWAKPPSSIHVRPDPPPYGHVHRLPELPSSLHLAAARACSGHARTDWALVRSSAPVGARPRREHLKPSLLGAESGWGAWAGTAFVARTATPRWPPPCVAASARGQRSISLCAATSPRGRRSRSLRTAASASSHWTGRETVAGKWCGREERPG